MIGSARVAVVIPAYNEADRIGETVRSVPACVDELIVVDDQSDDGTSRRALEAGDPRVRVIRHARNVGVGAAIAAGYSAAFAGRSDIAVVMAGDGQMDPRDLLSVIEPVVTGRAGYVTGNRLAFPNARQSMPFLRWLGNRWLGFLTRVAVGIRIEDSQCGYTAIDRRTAAGLLREGFWPRYGYPNDVLAKLSAYGTRMASVTVRPVYRNEHSGIGWRHALVVIPWLLARAAARRAFRRLCLPARRGLPQTSAE